VVAADGWCAAAFIEPTQLSSDGSKQAHSEAAMTKILLHHRIAGPADAPVLLLGGSLGTNLSMWDPQVAALSQNYRVEAFDHRGHGDSPLPPPPYEISDIGGA
jgi:pimeloyl-ACP methyl ester carboxylesterase